MLDVSSMRSNFEYLTPKTQGRHFVIGGIDKMPT